MRALLFALLVCPSAAVLMKGKGLKQAPASDQCHPSNKDQHIVFSTSCESFQHWQAEVLLNSAYHSGQCGSITRIVVGCEKEQHHSMISTHPSGAGDAIMAKSVLEQSTFPNLKVHMTPMVAEAEKNPWMNKPYSFKHWVENAGADIKERAVTILDPDEFFLQPLEQHREGTSKTSKTFKLLQHQSAMKKPDVTDRVEPGKAVAQLYGFGSDYLQEYNKSNICPGGASSPCATVSRAEGEQWYKGLGPPYILHNTDFKKVATTWWDTMKQVYPTDPGSLMNDMYAYGFAAVHNDVKHTQLENYMVSNALAPGEAWDFVDSLDSMSCRNPQLSDGKPRPTFLHAAGFYKSCPNGERTQGDKCPRLHEAMDGQWNFHKGHVPAQILDCDHPLLMQPPDDLFNQQHKAGNKEGKRNAFMICQLTFLINRASLEYKQKFCPSNFEQKKCTKIIADIPTPAAGTPENPWGYPLAMVDPTCMKGASTPQTSGKALSSFLEKGMLNVAYSVFISDIKSQVFKDVITVQAYGLRKAAQKSKHNVELVALVPERMPESDRGFLEAKGFKVVAQPLPLEIDEIDPVHGAIVRDAWSKIQGNGDESNKFSMAEESLKYWPLTWTQYDRVLMLDADVMVLDPMDELFERAEDFVGTYDHGLDIAGSTTPPVQGGFLLYRPNLKDFEKIKKVTKEGDFGGAGWKQSGIGYAYGGTGPDGMLAYFYHRGGVKELRKVGKENIRDGPYGQAVPGVRFFAADRSKYDVLINDRLRKDLKERDPKQILADVKSFHFTGDCAKPWQCGFNPAPNIFLKQGASNLCAQISRRWFQMRAEAQQELGLPAGAKSCVDGKGYVPMGL